MNHTSSLSDDVLVKLYRDGDERSFEILLKRHKQKIFAIIYLYVRDRYIAEDIFQDTFIKVINELKKGKYNEDGKFISWVLRIASNLCVDYYRKTKRLPTITNSEGKDVFQVIAFADVSGEENMIRSERQKTVRELIQQLPDEQKEVVILRHYARLSFKEIAKVTGTNLNTSLGRMRYALMNMRKMKLAVDLIADGQ